MNSQALVSAAYETAKFNRATAEASDDAISGWMVGDIKGAYLANPKYGSIIHAPERIPLPKEAV